MKATTAAGRVAAGLAVTVVDRARHLPEKLAELPVTMVSQALQTVHAPAAADDRAGDQGRRRALDTPPGRGITEWATFDRGRDHQRYDASNGRNGTRSRFETTELDDTADAEEPVDPWTAEESVIQRELDNTPPSALPGYPDLTMPQLRAACVASPSTS